MNAAGVAQLSEHRPSRSEVAGENPAPRSILSDDERVCAALDAIVAEYLRMRRMLEESEAARARAWHRNGELCHDLRVAHDKLRRLAAVLPQLERLALALRPPASPERPAMMARINDDIRDRVEGRGDDKPSAADQLFRGDQ